MNVIFDMDGVIFDTERLYLECCRPAAEKLGLTGVEEVAYECIGLTDVETHKKLRACIGDDALLKAFNQEIYRTFIEHYEKYGLTVKEGVFELLTYLKGTGARIAIGSSTEFDIVEKELRDAGLWQYFDVVVGGDMAKASKPAPDVFLLAAERLGVNIEDCVIIEDSFNGVRAARTAGATVFMVPDLLEPTEEIRALTDRVFGSLLDVKEWLAANAES
ncbi:MAG: HAD family phosphatase [Clostridia bacterium]|nr:HAD family phosphatase [Clostridia bacterium]